ncbi:MAG: DNA gyrase subunit A [Planctomycetota bacterium]|nr:MAG: DNA gyrase subunit A [Planctomycetota bacterium]
MKDAYLTYAMSVIISRALPDVRDGLKPSQRRILVAMHDLNLGPNAKFRKCAKICGDTSGNYHPHGEEVIYPTLVRMAQDFNIRYPLVDGQGNFGSVDGDPPAAMRYTEARMTAIAVNMLEDIDKDTVDFVPNYDETRTEPVVLPAKFPNLLVNGGSGIAVGMATNIPPHNLSEIVDGLVALIDNPAISVEELMRYVPGPDFPTGGIICGVKGIKEAYETGRGRIIVRARWRIEQLRGGRTAVVVTEIPYQMTKTRIIERMAELVTSGQVKGISDIRDESDRDGTRLVIEFKKGEMPQVVMNQLYKHGVLQATFGVIMLALKGGRPVTMSLKEMMQCYIDHRIEVILRRTQFLLDKAEKRLHIVQGLLVALDFIDEVIETIRSSRTQDEARKRLMERFRLTRVQADAILAMQLARLVGLERQKLMKERDELRAKIKDCWETLRSRPKVLSIIRKDLLEMKERYGDARRTEIVEQEPQELRIEDLIKEQDVAVTLTHAGYIKRTPLEQYRRQARGGKGMVGAGTRDEDFLEYVYVCSTHDWLLVFTSAGKVYWLRVFDIPEAARATRGRSIANLLQLGRSEQIQSVIATRDFTKGNLFFVTEKGLVKKTPLSAFSRPRRGGIIAITLQNGDRLVSALTTSGEDDVVVGTRGGMAIRFSEEEVRAMGRNARGVRGIRLRKGDSVCGAVVVEEGGTLLSVLSNGNAKRSPFEEYRRQARGGVGLINAKLAKDVSVVGLLAAHDEDELVLITEAGKMIRVAVRDIRVTSRATKGVRLIRLEKGDRIVSVARVERD